MINRERGNKLWKIYYEWNGNVGMKGWTIELFVETLCVFCLKKELSDKIIILSFSHTFLYKREMHCGVCRISCSKCDYERIEVESEIIGKPSGNPFSHLFLIVTY